MRFALLVRGINVGGKNKVVMAQLRQELMELGLEQVETYINSGNIFFESASSKAELVDLLGHFFRDHYPFIQSFLSFQLRTMRKILLLYQPGGRRIWPARMFSFTQKASIRMLSGSWSPLFRSVMKSSIVEDLGSTGANTQKRPIQRPLTTDKSSRCRITVS